MVFVTAFFHLELSLGFTHVVASISTLFLFIANISLCGCTKFYSSISYVDGYLSCFYFLAVKNNAAVGAPAWLSR